MKKRGSRHPSYEISATGQVQSLDRERITKTGRIVIVLGKPLTACGRGKAYVMVVRDGKQWQASVASLVALAWGGERSDRPAGYRTLTVDQAREEQRRLTGYVLPQPRL